MKLPSVIWSVTLIFSLELAVLLMWYYYRNYIQEQPNPLPPFIPSYTGPTYSQVDHLCSKVMSGDYSQLHLQSISYTSPDTLYISEPDHLYQIDASNSISPDGLVLPEHYIPWKAIPDLRRILNDHFLDIEGHPFAKQYIQSMYNISLGDDDGGSYLLNVILNQCEQMWLSTRGGALVKMPLSCSVWLKSHLDYALIMDRSREGVSGYVINEDMYTNTHYLIIYDLVWQPTDVLELGIQKMVTNLSHFYENYQKNPIPWANMSYFYIEKTSNPNEVRLVPKKDGESGRLSGNPNSQLLYSLPVGYIADDRSLHLFDSDLGCVYLISGMPTNLTAQFRASSKAILLQRRNVPFEDYFRCPEAYKLAKNFKNIRLPSRCDTTDEVQVLI